ncbi:hypothetical protein KSP39_PZI021128 [Platanthera zijinensis]|uniref:DUF4005 domain-containing protein n=1 Tax=Platanthera zijinensis TaxID=2320716 RepID=A0AAP0AWZ3_9ASPA
MVKAGRWLRNFLSGKKEKNHEKKKAADRRILPQLLPPPPPPPPSTPLEEQRRRSFSPETKRHKPPPPPAASLRRSATRKTGFSALEMVAAVKIQSSFRSFLARKALRALKGLVKLQAAVRGFLVRKQAAAALRSMQALLTVQGRARALRVRMSQESPAMPWKEAGRGRTTAAEAKLRQSTSISRSFQSKERSLEKLIEMEHAQSKASSSRGKKTNPTMQAETSRKSFSYHKSFSAPSPPTGANTGAGNARPDGLSVAPPARSSSQQASTSTNPHRIAVDESGMWRLSHDSSMFPNYMANTESWKAKARSQSAPRQRSGSPDSKQSGGVQRPSFDGKSLAGAAWAWSRSSSAAREQIPWAVVLDRSVTHAGY